MYIYEKYDYSMFEARFKDYNRLNNFSLGLRDLYEFLEEMAEGGGEPLELDVIAICCEFTESSIVDALHAYTLETLNELEENTTVIRVDDDHVIYANY